MCMTSWVFTEWHHSYGRQPPAHTSLQWAVMEGWEGQACPPATRLSNFKTWAGTTPLSIYTVSAVSTIYSIYYLQYLHTLAACALIRSGLGHYHSVLAGPIH